jgi:hypothetical protein
MNIMKRDITIRGYGRNIIHYTKMFSICKRPRPQGVALITPLKGAGLLCKQILLA